MRRDNGGEFAVYATPENKTCTTRKIPKNEVEGIYANVARYEGEGDDRYKNRRKRLEGYITQRGRVGKSMQLSYVLPLIKYVADDGGRAPAGGSQNTEQSDHGRRAKLLSRSGSVMTYCIMLPDTNVCISYHGMNPKPPRDHVTAARSFF